MNFLYIAHIPFVGIFFLFVLGLALANWRGISSEQNRDRQGAAFHEAAESTDPRHRARSSRGT